MYYKIAELEFTNKLIVIDYKRKTFDTLSNHEKSVMTLHFNLFRRILRRRISKKIRTCFEYLQMWPKSKHRVQNGQFKKKIAYKISFWKKKF